MNLGAVDVMNESNVVALRGGPTGEKVPVQCVVDVLEMWLQRAKDGEIQALGLVALYPDVTATFSTAGWLGSYSLVGAADVLRDQLVRCAREATE